MQAYTVIPGYERYEICNEYPHQIRRRDNQRIVSEHTNAQGYYALHLVNDAGARKALLKHVIIAKTFITNDDPINKTLVDHIDHNTTNNHISNLRWVTPRDNSINRSRSTRGNVQYEFVTELPLGSVKVTHYNQHQIDDVFFHSNTNVFYKKMADNLFRVMHQRSAPSGNRFVQTMSTLNKQVKLFNHVVRRDIDTYPQVNDEGDVIDEAEEEQ